MNMITLVHELNVELSKRWHMQLVCHSWLVHPKCPRWWEKLYFIALDVAVTSPTKQQTEGAYRVMYLKHNYCPSVEIFSISLSNTIGRHP